MRRLLAGLTDASGSAGLAAAAHLPPERLAGVARVAGYRPLPGELDPRPLMDRLAASGAALALPVAVQRDRSLVFRAWRGGDPLDRDIFGALAPLATQPEVAPDLVIAPLLAFDRRGRRLGRGGGAFDRTLAELRARGPVFVLGLGWSSQEASEVPWEPHDQRLDAILTETGYIEAGKDV